MQKNTKTLNKHEEFKLEFFTNLDAHHFIEKIAKLSRYEERLKDQAKKNRALYDLYFTYLQLVESLVIYSHATIVPTQDFPQAIFLPTDRIVAFIENNILKKGSSSCDELLAKLYIIPGDNTDKYMKDMKSLLQEAAKDYIDNYQLLNSYKHGGRLKASVAEGSVSIGLAGKKTFKVADYDSTISYYSKETNKRDDKKVTTVFKHTINFKKDRVYGKALFCASSLLNLKSLTRARLLQHVKLKKSEASRFEINMSSWHETFGSFNLKQPIFSYQEVRR